MRILNTQFPYMTGTNAYTVFIKAINSGYGAGHGNTWNATVWSESRGQALKYFI